MSHGGHGEKHEPRRPRPAPTNTNRSSDPGAETCPGRVISADPSSSFLLAELQREAISPRFACPICFVSAFSHHKTAMRDDQRPVAYRN